jgi:hypothetical protein
MVIGKVSPNSGNSGVGATPKKTGETEGWASESPVNTAAPKLKRPKPLTGRGCSGTITLSVIVYSKALRKTDILKNLLILK